MDNDVPPPDPAAGAAFRLTRRHLLAAAAFAGVGLAVARPAPSAVAVPPLVDPVRNISKPGLAVTQVGQLTGPRIRVTFSRATWTGGSTYLRQLELRRPDGSWRAVTSDPFVEQWVVLGGSWAKDVPLDYYQATDVVAWVTWTGFELLSPTSARLSTTLDGVGTLVAVWDVAGDYPVISHDFTAAVAGSYVVGYQSFDRVARADLTEVLCGAIQHSRVLLDNPFPIAAWELMVPASLRESNGLTLGTFIPSEVLKVEHERLSGRSRQAFAMTPYDDRQGLCPTAFAPAKGELGTLAAGESMAYAFGLVVDEAPLGEAVESLVRDEYGYHAYRANVQGSLTTQVHNMVDLVSEGPDATDDAYVASWSGWWPRLKGFAYTEIPQAVRTVCATALLSAYYLTGTDDALYRRRARPMMEYHLSRNAVGFRLGADSISVDGATWNQVRRNPLTLGTYATMLRGEAAAATVATLDGVELYGEARFGGETGGPAPWAPALVAHRLTGDAAWLTLARQAATVYAARRIEPGYDLVTGKVSRGTFGNDLVRRWIDLVVLWEETGRTDTNLLAAARTEARRLVTQTVVRPAPTSTQLSVQPTVTHQYDWGADGDEVWSDPLPPYPRRLADVAARTVPAWQVNTCGLTCEQPSSLVTGVEEAGGMVHNQGWGSFMMRLGAATGDQLLVDCAHNLLTGRGANYPGYYDRQFDVTHFAADFPYQGPPGVTDVYLHHVPAQISLALDQLFTEQEIRSGGRVRFPHVFESSRYAYFHYSSYGHAAGDFDGETGVWPYLPRGIVTISEIALNWLTGVGNGKLYLSVTNSSALAKTGTVTLGAIVGSIPAQVTVIRDDGTRTTVTVDANRSFPVSVPARSWRGVIVDGVGITPRPWHRPSPAVDHSTLSHATVGPARGVLLPRPDRTGFDAFVWTTCSPTDTASTLRYRINDGAVVAAAGKQFPYEWTIPVSDRTATFAFQVVTADGTAGAWSPILRLPATVTGAPRPGVVTAEADCGGTAVRRANLPIRVTLANGGSAPLTGISLALQGNSTAWILTTTTPLPATLPAGAVATAELVSRIPDNAGPGTYSYTGTVTHDGGTVAVERATVAVRDPLQVLWLEAEPPVLPAPGSSTTLRSYSANPGLLPVTGTITLTGPTGWTITDPERTASLPAGEVVEHTWTVTAPVTAEDDASHRFVATLQAATFGSRTHARHTDVPIAVQGVISHNGWSGLNYEESGTWRTSSLEGWQGRDSRYADSGTPSVTWRRQLPSAGSYRIDVWIPMVAEGATDVSTTAATYTVHQSGTKATVTLSQRRETIWEGRWRPLATVDLAAALAGVTVTRGASGALRVSAVRFVKVG